MNDYLAHKEIIETFFKKTLSHSLPKKSQKKRRKMPPAALAAAFLLLAFSAVIAIILIIASVRQSGGAGEYRGPVKLENLIENGVVNRFFIDEARFDGDSRGKSSFLKNSIRLVNAGAQGNAAFAISLKESLNLKKRSLLITARTESGLARLKLVLRDGKGNLFTAKEITLASRWSREYVFIEGAGNAPFDFTGVSGLEFEFGSRTAGNRPGATIRIKDLTIREGA